MFNEISGTANGRLALVGDDDNAIVQVGDVVAGVTLVVHSQSVATALAGGRGLGWIWKRRARGRDRVRQSD